MKSSKILVAIDVDVLTDPADAASVDNVRLEAENRMSRAILESVMWNSRNYIYADSASGTILSGFIQEDMNPIINILR